MTLNATLDAIIEHVSSTRMVRLSTHEKSEILQQVRSYVQDGDYSFNIPTANASYYEGKNSDYPRLYGDAVLAYTVSLVVGYKEEKQRKQHAC